jgi:hypothetical protein
MTPLHRPLALMLTALLAGCAPATTAPAPPAEEDVISLAGNRYIAISGLLHKPVGAPDKAEVMLYDELGKPVAEVGVARPNATGSFTFPRVLPGVFFALVTFEDKSTRESLVTTQSYHNPISPAGALTATFVHHLIDTKLIWVEDLPIQTLSGITFELEPLIADRNPPVEATPENRRNQFAEFRNRTTLLTRLTNELEETVNSRAIVNASQRPIWVGEAEYAEKKKKLGL